MVKHGTQLACTVYADVQAAFTYATHLYLLVHIVGAAHIHARNVAQHITYAVGLAHVDLLIAHLTRVLAGGDSDAGQFGIGFCCGFGIGGMGPASQAKQQ